MKSVAQTRDWCLYENSNCVSRAATVYSIQRVARAANRYKGVSL